MLEAHEFKLPITDEQTLKDFVRLSFGVTIPDVQVCPGHSTPWKAFADAYFGRFPVIVWWASRGFGGKSFLLSLLSLVEALTLKADVNILGGSGEQSARVHEHIRSLWSSSSSPTDYLNGEPIQRETRLVWGNSIRALLASQRSVRGPHPQRLRMDEIDEMDLGILDAAMGQPMAKVRDGKTIETQVVLSSTYQNPDGTMAEILDRANNKGWPVYQWCYHETMAKPTGWLTDSMVNRKKQDVTKAMWDIEYELQEPASETLAIWPEAVDAMFDRNLGVFAGAPGQRLEFETPERLGVYVSGADWAKKEDWTVMMVIRVDCQPYRIVAYQKTGRRPWPVMASAFDRLNLRFNVMCPAHDSTGVGDVVNDYLEIESEPIVMVGKQRTSMLTRAISMVEDGQLTSPMIESFYKALRRASVSEVYTPSGHLPDELSALACAVSAVDLAGWTGSGELGDLGEIEEYESRWS